ncbi:MAG TPA: TonB family protein, partial [Bryobacteraceae bacterium]
MESTARAERFEMQPAASPAYLWEVSQKPVSVRIPFALIDRLEGETVEAFRSLNSRGSEIGGVLFGKPSTGDLVVVSVEDYELISCDYSRGPLYRLSDADLGRFDRVISQHAAGSLPVVGFFRSHTRKGLALDAEDMVLFETRFKDPRKIALLIRPYATKACSAGFFIWEDGKIHVDGSHLEFPFRSSLLNTAKPVVEDSGMISAGLGGSALPPPSVPKNVMRAQIVPIASRREPAPAVAPEPAPVAAPAPLAPVEKAVAPAVPPAPVSKSVPTEAPETPAATTAEPTTKDTRPPAVAAPAPKTAPAAAAAPPVAKVEAPAAKVEVPPAKIESKPAAEPLAAEPETQPASGMATLRSSKFTWAALGAVVPLILMVVLFIYPGVLRRGSQPVSGVDSSALALRVERTGGELQLTWNRDSDPIRNATKAVLSISDGEQHQDVAMDLAQLQKGSIAYTPATADVVFRMEVSGKGDSKTGSEMVRALSTRPSPLADIGSPTPAKNAAPDVKAPENTVVTPPAAAEVPPADDSATKPPQRQLKPFQAESLSQRLHPAATQAEVPDAPSVGRVNAQGVSVPALNMNAIAPPPQAPAAPSKAAPATEPGKAAVQSGGQIQPAVLIHRKEPDYPRLARETGAKGVVELTATIGTDGKVKKVTVVRGHPMLVKAASDAVMQWIYKPTILNGTPVEAQT